MRVICKSLSLACKPARCAMLGYEHNAHCCRSKLWDAIRQMMDILNSIPEDVASQILDLLLLKDRLACCLVCKSWHGLALDRIGTINIQANCDKDIKDVEGWMASNLDGQQTFVQQLMWDFQHLESRFMRTTPFLKLTGTLFDDFSSYDGSHFRESSPLRLNGSRVLSQGLIPHLACALIIIRNEVFLSLG